MSRKAVVILATRHAAEVVDRDTGAITVWSPPGVAWRASDCHVLAASYRPGGKDEAWRLLLDDLRSGVVRCDAGAHCDTCAEILDRLGGPDIVLTRGQLESWAGRVLSDDELSRLDDAIPHSSIPQAIAAIVDSWNPQG